FGRKDVVEHLLQTGANVHARDDGGLIPLHNACSFGHAEVVSLLLCQGADPNARDNWNYTPLHEASIKGKIDVCIGMEPCHLHLSPCVVFLLGEYKKDELLEAARSGNEEKLMALLTPLNVNCHASDGRKVASLKTSIVFLLPLFFDTDEFKGNSLLQAAREADMAKVKKSLALEIIGFKHPQTNETALVNAVDTLGQTALHRAALAGHIQTCKLLLSCGADPSIVSLQGFTAAQMGNEAKVMAGFPLQCSLFKFTFPENVPTRNSDVDYRFLEAAKAGDLDTVQNRDGNIPLDMVKDGDTDIQDLLRGDAALLDAAKKGCLARVQKLCSPENINCRDAQGRNSTPLHLAGTRWMDMLILYCLDSTSVF
ncbi:hypothetical protein XENOCAPTIV_003928, partial [Xenoophorus captivus]